jgi:hypothetical protein
MDFTTKIRLLYDYKKNKNNKKMPYKHVIGSDLIDYATLLNDIYNDDISNNCNFDTKRKFIVYFTGIRTFNTVIMASSYVDLNDIITTISKDTINYSKKNFDNSSDFFMDKIVITTDENDDIDITHMLNTCISYECDITFNDIIILHNNINDKIQCVKLYYYKNTDHTIKKIAYDECKNSKIDDIVLYMK